MIFYSRVSACLLAPGCSPSLPSLLRVSRAVLQQGRALALAPGPCACPRFRAVRVSPGPTGPCSLLTPSLPGRAHARAVRTPSIQGHSHASIMGRAHALPCARPRSRAVRTRSRAVRTQSLLGRQDHERSCGNCDPGSLGPRTLSGPVEFEILVPRIRSCTSQHGPAPSQLSSSRVRPGHPKRH